MASPASVYCGQLGGRSVTRYGRDGGAVGYCRLRDGREVDEWALYRARDRRTETGDRGARPIGMADPAARYCGEVGGLYYTARGYRGETGYCRLRGGRTADAWQLYRAAGADRAGRQYDNRDGGPYARDGRGRGYDPYGGQQRRYDPYGYDQRGGYAPYSGDPNEQGYDPYARGTTPQRYDPYAQGGTQPRYDPYAQGGTQQRYDPYGGNPYSATAPSSGDGDEEYDGY